MSCNQVWPPAATNVSTEPGTSLDTNITGPVDALGGVNVSEMVSVVQRSWIHDIQPQLDITVDHETGTVGATYTVTGGELVLATGATGSSKAYYRTHYTIPFDQNKPVASRFSAKYGVSGETTEQLAGMGDADNALAFGYNGTAFGVLHRSGGEMEVRRLEITTGTTIAGSVTITLDGQSDTVSLGGLLTIAQVAHTIGLKAWGSVSGGWRAVSQGQFVYFIAIDTTTRGGAYSFVDTGGTSAAATFATHITAVAATDVWIPQTSWNLDKADGTGTLPVLATANGNSYEIQYQASGYGSALFRIMNPDTGYFVDVHRIKHGNSSTSLLMQQPNLALYAEASNSGDVAGVADFAISDMSGFRSSSVLRNSSNIRYAVDTIKSVAAADICLLVIRHPLSDSVAPTRSRSIMTIEKIVLGNNSSTHVLTVQVFLNPRITGTPSFATASGDSFADIDTASTLALIGEGRQPLTLTAGSLNTFELTLSPEEQIVMEPGDVIAIVAAQATGASSAEVTAGIIWNETR